MIYIFSLLITCLFAIRFDLLGKQKDSNYCYALLMIWFISLSVFQYGVGVDIINYERTYSQFDFEAFKFQKILEYQEYRMQPGWVLLIYLFHFISNDFFLMRALIVIFVNISIFIFIKKESDYPFLCVLLYALFGYLVINFNMLRQSISMAIFLNIYPYIKQKKMIKYYIGALAAYMFHNSALILLIIPFVAYLKYNKFLFFVMTLLLFSGILFVLFADWGEVLVFMIDNGLVDVLNEHDSNKMSSFMEGARLGYTEGGRYNIIGIIYNLLLHGFPALLIIYYAVKKENIQIPLLSIIYLVLSIMAINMPIFWRFRAYFDFFFFIVATFVFMDLYRGQLRQARPILCMAAICILSFSVYRELFTPLKEFYGLRYIDQYYPYHSIFDPEDEPVRQKFLLQ